MKKLLVLTSTYPRNSSDPEPQFIHELSKRMIKHFDVHVLCPHAYGVQITECLDNVNVHRFRYAPANMEKLIIGGGIVANLKKNPIKWLLVPLFFIAQIYSMLRIIKQLRPDCIHVHWIIPQGLSLSIVGVLIKLPPVVITSHGGDIYTFSHNILFDRLKVWILKRAQKITLVNELMRAELERLGLDSSAAEIIPMGVDNENRFVEGNVAAERNKNSLLFIGRLVEKKGIIFLLEAVRKMYLQNSKLSLTIIGYGPEEEKIREYISIHRMGYVNLMGALSQEELPIYYQSCGIFIAPFVKAKSGDQDGYPVALMEAIFCGAPVVSTKLPQILNVFGVYAKYFCCEPESVNGLVDTIRKIQLNYSEYQQYQLELRAVLQEQLNWRTISARFLVLLDDVSVKAE